MEKIFTNTEKQAEPFPQLQDYDKLIYAPEQLADINPTEGNKLNTAINDEGQVISDVINSALDTQSKEILASYTFGSSGAIKIATDSDNGIWISPSGILGKHAGSVTFTLDSNGNATFSGDIVAATITGGTVTGSTIQTSTSGQRVVLDSSNDYIKFYDSNGNLAGTIKGAPTYGIYSDGDFYINGNLNGVQNLNAYYLSIWKGSGAGIEPTYDNSITIGSASYRWSNVYSVAGNFSGNVTVGGNVYGGFYTANGVTSGSHQPYSDNAYDLGNTTYYWRNIYSKGQIFAGSASISGQVYCDSVATSDLDVSGIASAQTVMITGTFLELKQMSGSTASGYNPPDGSMYYRTDDNVIRVKLGGSWYTVSTTS